MRSLNAQHLISDSSLLGLAIADQLLRRGAEGVVILGGSDRTRPTGTPGWVLSSGLPDYEEWDERGTFLLEEWQTYLQADDPTPDAPDTDPSYQRCGSVATGFLLEPHGARSISWDLTRERIPELVLDPEEEIAFHPGDGWLNAAAITAALAWRVREKGGLFVSGCELQSIAPGNEGVAFVAALREGTAREVYLTSGPGDIALLSRAGLLAGDSPGNRWGACQLQTFELEIAVSPAWILRLENDPPGFLLNDGKGHLFLTMVTDAAAGGSDPRIDWTCLESFRAAHSGLLPILESARIHRGAAEHRLDIVPRVNAIADHPDEHVIAAGGFGIHTLPLSLAAAEAVVEITLNR